MKRKLIYIAIPVIIITALVFYFITKNGAVVVEQVEVEEREILKTVSANGEIKSEQSTDLSFSVSGEIALINAKEGDTIEPDQILATLDSSAAFQTSQAYLQAKNAATKDRDIFKEQYQDNLDAIGGRQEYELKLNQLIDKVNQAEATYQSSLAALNNYRLIAPYSATIIEILKDEKEKVTATEVIVKLANLQSLHFEALVDQEDIGIVSLGQEVIIELDTYKNEEFKGTVIEIPKYISTANSDTFNVKVNINNINDKSILLGMKGESKIVIDKLIVPNSLQFDSIFYDDDEKPFVWIVEKEILNKEYVQTGLEGDIYTEIKNDLSSFTIVTPKDSKIELKEGMKVKID